MTMNPDDAKTIGAVLNSEAGQELTKPALSELGGLLGDVASVIRFYATENLKQTFTRWSHHREGRELSSDEIRRVMPLLQSASMVSDEELQERWGALLETASRGGEDYLPSFSQTLSQMTAEEARFLRNIWVPLCGPRGLGHYDRPTARDLLSIHHSDIDRSVVWDASPSASAKGDPFLFSLIDRRMKLQLMLDELVRLDILATNPVDVDDRRSGVFYRFTHYGAMFLRAVDSTA
jgi:Abortive infection alpha